MASSGIQPPGVPPSRCARCRYHGSPPPSWWNGRSRRRERLTGCTRVCGWAAAATRGRRVNPTSLSSSCPVSFYFLQHLLQKPGAARWDAFHGQQVSIIRLNSLSWSFLTWWHHMRNLYRIICFPYSTAANLPLVYFIQLYFYFTFISFDLDKSYFIPWLKYE